MHRFGRLFAGLLLPVLATAGVLEDHGVPDQPVTASPEGVAKGSAPNLDIGSILLRVDGDDAIFDPVVHNIEPGMRLRVQVRYRASGFEGSASHFIRLLVDGQAVCEGTVQIENGSRAATCPAVEFGAGVTTVSAVLDVNDDIAESDEEDNTQERAYDTRVFDPLDHIAGSVALVDAPSGGLPIDDPMPGEDAWLQFTFEVQQAVNWYWRAELGLDGARACAFFFADRDPEGDVWTITCNDPVTIPEGPFSIYGFVDPNFEQEETDETNNEALSDYDVDTGLPEGVRVDVLELPLLCCTPPPPNTRLGAVISSDLGRTAVGEPFAGDGRLATFGEGRFEGFPNAFEDFVFVPDGFDAVNFGSAVAVVGDLMVVGAPILSEADLARHKGGNPDLRAALYQRVDEGWDFKTPISPDDGGQPDDQFGFAVAIEGDMIVIGAPSDSEGEEDGEGSGAVYTFSYDGNVVTQEDKAKADSAVPGMGFGAALATGPGKVVVGAPASALGAAVAGSATLFDAVAGNLSSMGTVRTDEAGDGFGTTLDLAGSTIIVGAPGHDEDGMEDAGAAHVFSFDGNDLRAEGMLLDPEPRAGGAFGSAVATTGDEFTIGAPGATGVTDETSGAIYRFDGMEPFLRIPAPVGRTLTGDVAFEGFGASLDLAGGDIAIGAPGTAEERGAAAIATGLPDATHSGPWFATGQSGHGWFLEHLAGSGDQPDRINGYWYVYLDEEQVWVTGQGPLVDGRAELDMFITDGPDFPPDFLASDVNLQPWGTLVFEFDGETGTAAWESVIPAFGAGSLPIQRIAPVASASTACRSGSYYNADQSGHGFVVQIFEIDGQLEVLVTWYVYQDGAQVWLLGQAPIVNDEAVLPMLLFTGGDFPPDFDPDALFFVPWGDLTIRFTGPDTAEVSWMADLEGYPDGSLSVTRITTLRGRSCER